MESHEALWGPMQPCEALVGLLFGHGGAACACFQGGPSIENLGVLLKPSKGSAHSFVYVFFLDVPFPCAMEFATQALEFKVLNYSLVRLPNSYC